MRALERIDYQMNAYRRRLHDDGFDTEDPVEAFYAACRQDDYDAKYRDTKDFD